MSAVERLAAALHARWHGTPYEASMVFSEEGHRILAADPALADAIELGLAWQEAEAVWNGGGFPLSVTSYRPLDGRYIATAGMDDGEGDTPAAALRALAEKLRGAT